MGRTFEIVRTAASSLPKQDTNFIVVWQASEATPISGIIRLGTHPAFITGHYLRVWMFSEMYTSRSYNQVQAHGRQRGPDMES